MKALILAAGRGLRLWPYTANLPKCLLRIGQTSILERQFYNLEQAGIHEVVLVCGFGVDRIRDTVETYPESLHIKILYNPFYAISDNLISLWVARSEMDRDFVLLNGDNVFHPAIVQRLLQTEEICCLMVDRKAFYDDDDMKLQLQDGRIRKIGKTLPTATTDAESIGIMRFSGEGVDLICQMLEEIVLEKIALRSYFLAGIQYLIDQGYPVAYREVGDLPWADVDTPEDLHQVRHRAHLYQSDAVLHHGTPLYEKTKGVA